MLDNKIPVAANKQSGFSLVELMVALVLGLLITAAVTAMTVSSLKLSGNTLKSARLNQDLGAVMQIVVNDIRRAGYVGDAGPFSTNEDINIVSSSCVLYSYNRNDDSSIDDNERNGFKLDAGGIKMRTSCTGANCYMDCSLGTWVELTDPDIVAITDFEVNSENSKCHNIDGDRTIRIAPDVSAIKFACNETDKDNLQEGVVEYDDWIWKELSGILEYTMTDSLKTWGSADPIVSVGVRHANILLRGVFNDPFVEAGSNYNEYPIRKSLDVSIKVRNDHVYEVAAP